MPKLTHETANSSTVPVKKLSRRASVDDWGGMPRRSEKFGSVYAHPELVFGSGAPDLGGSLAPAPAALDTSADLPTNTPQAFPKKNLQKRARSKYVTNEVVSMLAQLPSVLENSYRTTLRCSGHLTEKSGKLSGLYCGQRWCLVCSRIRTARCIAGYLPALREMPNKWFLTLTVPNVRAGKLKTTIRDMLTNASNIHRVLKEKQRLRYSSLRKLECTYNESRGDFHPHFHFIFSSELAARAFLASWLKRYPNATHKAQDLRKADDNSCLELFKYFTKVVSKTKGTAGYRIHIKALDTMFIAMRGVRTFQPSGVVKLVSEEIEELQTEATNRDYMAAWSWLNECADWINKETGELLTNYTPSAAIKEIAAHIVSGEQSDRAKYGEIPSSDSFSEPEEAKNPSAEASPLEPGGDRVSSPASEPVGPPPGSARSTAAPGVVESVKAAPWAPAFPATDSQGPAPG